MNEFVLKFNESEIPEALLDTIWSVWHLERNQADLLNFPYLCLQLFEKSHKTWLIAFLSCLLFSVFLYRPTCFARMIFYFLEFNLSEIIFIILLLQHLCIVYLNNLKAILLTYSLAWGLQWILKHSSCALLC